MAVEFARGKVEFVDVGSAFEVVKASGAGDGASVAPKEAKSAMVIQRRCSSRAATAADQVVEQWWETSSSSVSQTRAEAAKREEDEGDCWG